MVGATDFSDRTWKDVVASCEYHGVKYKQVGTKLELGTAIGKSPRGLVGITDEKFADSLEQKLNQQ